MHVVERLSQFRHRIHKTSQLSQITYKFRLSFSFGTLCIIMVNGHYEYDDINGGPLYFVVCTSIGSGRVLFYHDSWSNCKNNIFILIFITYIYIN